MRYLVTNIQWGKEDDALCFRCKTPSTSLGLSPVERYCVECDRDFYLKRSRPGRVIVEVDCSDEIPAALEREHEAKVLSCQWEPLPDVDPITRRELLQQGIAKAGSSTKLASILVREPRHIRRMLSGDAHIADTVLMKCQEIING